MTWSAIIIGSGIMLFVVVGGSALLLWVKYGWLRDDLTDGR